MRLLFFSLIMFTLFATFSGAAIGQGARVSRQDSTMLAAVKTLQSKLGLSDAVTGKLVTARLSMIQGLDSLKGRGPTDSKTSGSASVRLQQQYRVRVRGLLTTDQWTRYQQLEQAALDSFYVRMRTKRMRVKSQSSKN